MPRSASLIAFNTTSSTANPSDTHKTETCLWFFCVCVWICRVRILCFSFSVISEAVSFMHSQFASFLISEEVVLVIFEMKQVKCVLQPLLFFLHKHNVSTLMKKVNSASDMAQSSFYHHFCWIADISPYIAAVALIVVPSHRITHSCRCLFCLRWFRCAINTSFANDFIN